MKSGAYNFILAIIMAILAISTQAADIKAGRDKAVMCQGCHGLNGNSVVPIFPKLAGQHAAYLESALKAYRDGLRNSDSAKQMIPMATILSDDDITNLAAFFSQVK
jgi:cytochrome c553